MSHKIVSVNFQFPGGDVEHCEFDDKDSLLDYDIIVYSPTMHGSYETYMGKPSLDDDQSFRAKENLAHWKRALAAAVQAGKLVIIYLNTPAQVYAATGTREVSGTGRNQRTTRHVNLISSYEAIPQQFATTVASGNEILISPQAKFFTQYWNEFGEHTSYEVFLDGKFSDIILRTKSGERIVGGSFRKDKGALILLPPLEYSDKVLVDRTGKEPKWTSEAKIIGKKLASSLIAIAEGLASDFTISAAPEWASDNKYRLPDEEIIESQITEITNKVSLLEQQKSELYLGLDAVISFKRLLYEQGKPLENIVLQALKLLGFAAENYKENGSEFDAVFTSPEGRFIGEIEGKDNKAINVDKYSQLQRNLDEDFARDEVSEHAKGVIIGNAYRLKHPKEREFPFTEKCVSGAKRSNVALIHTPDLYEPCSYLRSNHDPEYAKKCREAIFNSKGELVVFPQMPKSEEADTLDLPNKIA